MEIALDKKRQVEQDFFKRYKAISKVIKDHVVKQGFDDVKANQFACLLLNRLMVVYFLQEIKGIYNANNFLINAIKEYLSKGKKHSFYKELWLKLFLEDSEYGMLFDKTDVDEQIIDVSNEVMLMIIEEFLEKFKFTTKEGNSQDLDVVISPEMLSKLYESIIAEEEKGKSGIFYTSQIQVDLMCRLSMYEFFLKDNYDTIPKDSKINEKLVDFIFTPLKKWDFNKKNEFRLLKEALENVKIVDPACGSGAFLVGMFQVLLELYQKLDIKININFKKDIVKNSLFGIDVKDWAIKIAEIRLWLKILENEESIFENKLSPRDFLVNLYTGDALLQSTWELNFPDIIKNGGFDIVITNPPYVRQEDIMDSSLSLEVFNQKTDSEKRKLKENYKNKLISQVSISHNQKISKKSDYYVFFFFKAIEIARENGVIVFLTSNSWLDVQFGSQLREGLLKNTHVKAIIENLSRRSFKTADINTIFTVLTKKNPEEQVSGKTRFISFFKPYREIFNSTITNEVFALKPKGSSKNIEFFNVNLTFKREKDYRIVTISESDLWTLDTKWSKFLKAPEIYFRILEDHKDFFARLRDIASFTYGEKTGANDFFFLGKPGGPHKYFKSKYDSPTGNLLLYLKNEKYLNLFEKFLASIDEPIFTIEKEYWMHVMDSPNDAVDGLFEHFREESNNITWVPNYLIKSPKELTNIVVPPRNLNKIYLIIPKEEYSLKEGIRKYIKWGEMMSYHARPSCSRTPWYALNPSAREDIMCVELIHDRYFFAYNKYKLLYDHTIYGFSFEEASDINGALLNSTLIALFMEFQGRTTYGDGALGLMQYEYETLLTIKPEIVDSLKESDKNILRSYFKGEMSSSLDSIFIEIGTINPNEIRIDEIKPSRRKIDKIVFEKILNLSEEDQLEIYKSVITLVKRRLEKAKGIENLFL